MLFVVRMSAPINSSMNRVYGWCRERGTPLRSSSVGLRSGNRRNKEKHGSNNCCACCQCLPVRRVFVLCGVATHTTCSGSHAAGRWMAIQPRLRRRTASVCSWLHGLTTKSVPLASLQACVAAGSSPRTRVAAMACIILAVQFRQAAAP